MRIIRRTALNTSILAMALTAANVAADDSVRCESRHGRYQYCAADVTNRIVRVNQVYSKTDCRQGRNWGYDRHGVWVDQGCDALFDLVDDRHHNKHGHQDDDDDDKTTAVVGAAVGIALIAALASQGGSHAEEVAPWAIGDFVGYDETEHSDVRLTILPGGSVKGAAGSNAFTGNLNGTKLQTGRYHFVIVQSGNGFIATEDGNSRHRVNFRRSGSGY